MGATIYQYSLKSARSYYWRFSKYIMFFVKLYSQSHPESLALAPSCNLMYWVVHSCLFAFHCQGNICQFIPIQKHKNKPFTSRVNFYLTKDHSVILIFLPKQRLVFGTITIVHRSHRTKYSLPSLPSLPCCLIQVTQTK